MTYNAKQQPGTDWADIALALMQWVLAAIIFALLAGIMAGLIG